MTAGRQPKGQEEGDSSGECLWRKARQPWRQGVTTESCAECRAITVASLSPRIGAGSWPIEKDSRECGPLSACCAKQQRRVSQGGPLNVRYPWPLASLYAWSQQGLCYPGAVLPPCLVLTGAELPEAREKPISTIFPAPMAPGFPVYLAPPGSL